MAAYVYLIVERVSANTGVVAAPADVIRTTSLIQADPQPG